MNLTKAQQNTPGQSGAAGTGVGREMLPAEQTQVYFGGRYWILAVADAQKLALCPICYEGVARHVLCPDIRHAVCIRCQSNLLQGPGICQSCRAPFETEDEQQVLEKTLREQQQASLEAVVVRCVDCSWSGPLAGVEQHGTTCWPRMSFCRWNHGGCDWQGLRDDQASHEAACRWQPVTCTLPGCGASMPLWQKSEHERACGDRPMALAGIVITAGQMNAFDSIYRLCGDDSLLNDEPASVQRREETLPSIMLAFRLAYDAARTAPQPAPVVRESDCLWGCDYRAPMEQMKAHYATCPRLEVRCSFCDWSMPRSRLAGHMVDCEDKPAACPRGCGAPGLRARDITDAGAHSAECSRRLICDDCHDPVTTDQGVWNAFARFSREQHKPLCSAQAVRCHWCLDRHPGFDFQARSALCQKRQPSRLILFRNMPLELDPQSNGPVYISRERGDQAVFIWLSTDGIVAQKKRREGEIDMTPSLHFSWNGMPCSLTFGPHETRHFCFALKTQSPREPQMRLAAYLRRRDGTLLEGLGGGWRFGSSSEPQILLQNGSTDSIGLSALYRAINADKPDHAFLLHLDTQAWCQ